jgi:acyl dehydratase
VTEATTTTVVPFDELGALPGRVLGPSAWRDIDQERIDTFATAADDHQWIHVDPQRAADGPFGGTIAHGFLTLSLLIPLWTELLDVPDVTTKVVYGLNRVRFPSPVRSGSRIRAAITVASVQEVPGNGREIVADIVIETPDGGKPACVAQAVFRFYRAEQR